MKTYFKTYLILHYIIQNVYFIQNNNYYNIKISKNSASVPYTVASIYYPTEKITSYGVDFFFLFIFQLSQQVRGLSV